MMRRFIQHDWPGHTFTYFIIYSTCNFFLTTCNFFNLKENTYLLIRVVFGSFKEKTCICCDFEKNVILNNACIIRVARGFNPPSTNVRQMTIIPKEVIYYFCDSCLISEKSSYCMSKKSFQGRHEKTRPQKLAKKIETRPKSGISRCFLSEIFI